MPGLGRQPQAPSSAVPVALAAAVPGVRSEPRPEPVPEPRPPPSGGSVKPGGDGGGGGSPTRAGAGGGGGPAGGELAANTFPMVACKGKGQRAEVRASAPGPVPSQPPPCSGRRFSLAAAPVPGLGSAPTPCATHNRTHCRRRHHHRPSPHSLLVQLALGSAHRLKSLALLLVSRMEAPATFFDRPFLLAPTLKHVEAHHPALLIDSYSPRLLVLDPAGSGAVLSLVCAEYFATPTDSPPPPLFKRRPSFDFAPQ